MDQSNKKRRFSKWTLPLTKWAITKQLVVCCDHFCLTDQTEPEMQPGGERRLSDSTSWVWLREKVANDSGVCRMQPTDEWLTTAPVSVSQNRVRVVSSKDIAIFIQDFPLVLKLVSFCKTSKSKLKSIWGRGHYLTFWYIHSNYF